MIKRQFPQWGELRTMIQLRNGFSRPTVRQIAAAATISDLRGLAYRRTPKPIFDYVDGGGDTEVGLRQARRLYEELGFRPRVLRDVSRIDPSCTLLGNDQPYPFILAPTGFTRMVEYEGELAVAPAAAEFGIPYGIATMCTVAPEDIMAAAPGGTYWYQIPLMKDHALGNELMQRAWGSGMRTLIVTVDTPVSGRRVRDRHSGLTIPPSLTWRSMLTFATHPRWSANMLTTPALEFAALRGYRGSLAETAELLFDPSAQLSDLKWIRDAWPGHILIKGVDSLSSAKEVIDDGIDGLVLSTHGGRQLGAAAPPLLLLPDVVAMAHGRCQVFIDSGITRGSDIVAAVALGADGCLVGRSYLYGLMAGGRGGVLKALQILGEEIETTMALLGAARLRDLSTDMVEMMSWPSSDRPTGGQGLAPGQAVLAN